jgi:chemotaxis protein CheX
MELIQPFIDAADAVFSETLQSPAKIADLSMDENTYRRKGVAAVIAIRGDIEGRIVLDLSPDVAVKIASQLAGTEILASEQVVRETVCELANMVIGNCSTIRVFVSRSFPRRFTPGKKAWPAPWIPKRWCCVSKPPAARYF